MPIEGICDVCGGQVWDDSPASMHRPCDRMRAIEKGLASQVIDIARIYARLAALHDAVDAVYNRSLLGVSARRIRRAWNVLMGDA